MGDGPRDSEEIEALAVGVYSVIVISLVVVGGLVLAVYFTLR